MSERAEQGSLRDRQQEAARRSIVGAYLALAHRDGALTVSIAAVAEEAGVSRRTVYRYFPNKGDLQHAAAFHMSEEAMQGGTMADVDPGNLADRLKVLWSGLAENLPAVFAERMSPAGRELRITRLDRARASAAAAFPGEADPQSIDLLVAVTSSSMFLELVERMSYPPEVAADMATRLGQLIIEAEK